MSLKVIFKDFFEGRIKLWKSFWLYGEFLYGAFILLLIQIDKYFLNNSSENGNFLSIFNLNNLSFISKIILVIWTFFIVIGVWRSAENYKGNIIFIISTFVYYGYRIFSLKLLF